MARLDPMLPIIDVTPLRTPGSDRAPAAAAIRAACRELGFFYVAGHGIDPALLARLEDASRAFFALPLERKLAIRMDLGGRAWRGYFPPGAELTSGRPDRKEGIYFGAELDEGHPKVRAGAPFFGPNLFPQEVPALREAVLAYIDHMSCLGHTLMEGIALSLVLGASYFADRYTRDPLVLFRIFNYPAPPGARAGEEREEWGVGEHTDYGLLTILGQDGSGGLQVKTPAGTWLDAAPVPGTFICNIGDMLDRMTGGLYRSTPHRVRNTSRSDRISYPFFFDPGVDAEIQAIDPVLPADDDRERRWDRTSVHAFRGRYGDYLLNKVSKVFPQLTARVIPKG